MIAATRSRSVSSRRFDSPEQEAYLGLWRTYDRLRAIEEELFARWDLTGQQYNLLRLIRAAHPEPVPTLSVVSRLVSRAPDVTRMFDRLEQRQLITRTRSETDRRTVLIGLTHRGMELLNEIAGPLKQCHRKQLGHLEPDELRTLIDLLHRVREPHEPDDSPWT
jgi:DNA-binding MarR family transcriptional regulator